MMGETNVTLSGKVQVSTYECTSKHVRLDENGSIYEGQTHFLCCNLRISIKENSACIPWAMKLFDTQN